MLDFTDGEVEMSERGKHLLSVGGIQFPRLPG